jgi:hypothetical protein
MDLFYIPKLKLRCFPVNLKIIPDQIIFQLFEDMKENSFLPPSISLIYLECQYSLRIMRDTSEMLDTLRSMRHELAERYHVRSIGIFGSYSKKHQTEQSDLDLVVEFDQPIGMMAFVYLKNLIADRLDIKVDLVTPDGLHPLIRDQVMHEVVYV